MTENILRVILADDHALVMEGLLSLIANTPDIRVIATATDGERLLDAVERFKPDAVVTDIHMPYLSGTEVVGKIRAISPKTRIVFLTAYTDVQTLQDVIDTGAEGLLYKTDPPEQVLHAIRQVSLGQLVFPSSARKLLYRVQKEDTPLELSPRELDVLELVSHGKTNQQIAHELQISVSTVKFHLQNIYKALDVSNRTEAGYWYLNNQK